MFNQNVQFDDIILVNDINKIYKYTLNREADLDGLKNYYYQIKNNI